MNHLYKNILLGLLFVGSVASFGQISNEGTFSIAENTAVVFAEDFTNTSSGMLSNNGVVHVKGNLINDGGFTFDDPLSNQSITEFSGSAAQNISGMQMIEIPRLQLSNDAGYQLVADILVTKEADFKNGIVNNRDYGGELSFEPGVTLTNVSNQSHVNGAILKLGSDAFDFPLGANGYVRTIGLKGIADETTLLSGQYFPENSNESYAHDQKQSTILFIDNSGFWELKNMQGSETALLTLSWNTATAPSEIVNAQESVHIVHWNPSQATWIDLGGNVNVTNQTVTTPTAVEIDGIFTLATVVPDNTPEDEDSDGDGVPDAVDAFPNDPEESIDNDGDGIGANTDLDDNDASIGSETLVIAAQAFTPNGDGINDTWVVKGIENYPNSTVVVYNRYGHEVFTAKGYKNNWDGRYASKAQPLPAGSYYYIANLGDGSTPVDGWLFINY